MKRSYRTFDDGGTGMETNVSNTSDVYNHVFDSSSSFGIKLSSDSPSFSRDKSSSFGTGSGRASKRSIVSKISQWTNDNPFGDTDESRSDVRDSSKSARTDKASSCDDSPQVVRQIKKTDGTDARGDDSTTTPFKMHSHTSPTETIVALQPIQENDLSECDSLKDSKHMDSLLSLDSRMMEEIMKRSGQNPEARASLSDVNLMKVSFVIDSKDRVEGAIASPTDHSPSLSRDKSSSVGSSHSSNPRKQSIMSEISQWTKENPFNDSFDVEKDMHNSSDRGLTLL